MSLWFSHVETWKKRSQRGGRTFWVEGKASAMAMRWEQMGQPVWLELSVEIRGRKGQTHQSLIVICVVKYIKLPFRLFMYMIQWHKVYWWCATITTVLFPNETCEDGERDRSDPATRLPQEVALGVIPEGWRLSPVQAWSLGSEEAVKDGCLQAGMLSAKPESRQFLVVQDWKGWDAVEGGKEHRG